MSISSRREEVNIHQCYFAPIFLHNVTLLHSKGHDGNNNNNNVINNLDIAQGLKDMLVSHGFNLKSLLIMRPHDLIWLKCLGLMNMLPS
jgi:hypothetical protein